MNFIRHDQNATYERRLNIYIYVGTRDRKTLAWEKIDYFRTNTAIRRLKLLPKIEDLNVRLKQVCANNNWGIITHRNIAAKQLNPYGLHLNRQGSTKFAGNFIEYFKHCSWQSITDVSINVEGDKNSTDSAMLETSASSPFSKLKGFKIGQINIASLVKHHDELLVYMQSKSLDVLTVNETRLDISVLDCEVEIPGYDIVRLDRNRIGGGVAIFILKIYHTLFGEI